MPTPGYALPPTGQALPPAAYAPPTGYPPPSGLPPQPPAGYPSWGTAYPPYGASHPGAGFVPTRPTNGLAIASLACSAGGVIPFFFGIPCVVGIVLGFVALGQIKRSGGLHQGRGLAIAGIAVGFSLIAIFILVVGIAVGTSHNNQ
jgi:hypothetical protein